MSDGLQSLLLPYQLRFAQAPQKNKLFLSGRQLGKSFVLAYMAARKVLTSPRGQNALALCISTGSRASQEFVKKCVDFAEAVRIMEPSITYRASSDCLKFSTGGRIISLPSGNPAALRGWTADLCLIDEAAYIENPDEVYASIAPTLTRYRDTELVVASTPAGKNSWFYQKYLEAAADPSSWHCQVTTVEDAVAEGLELDLERLRNTIADPDVWDREYMCRFAADFGSLIDLNVLEFEDPPNGFRPKGRWIGMDIGSTSDRTAYVTLAELPDGGYFVEDAVVLHRASYEHQLEVLKELHERNAYAAGFVDATGLGGPVAEFASTKVSARIKGFTFTSSSKAPCYEKLRALCFDHKLKFATHLKELVEADFSNVARVVSESGRVSYQAGRGGDGHSDFTSALVLAIQAAVQQPVHTALPSAAPPATTFGNTRRMAPWHSRL